MIDVAIVIILIIQHPQQRHPAIPSLCCNTVSTSPLVCATVCRQTSPHRRHNPSSSDHRRR